MIYLDYNATTPIDPAVAEAMRPFIETHFGNPSSGHDLGKTAKEAVASARRSVARLINAEASEIIFTSGGTEAGNMAIKSVAELQASKGRHFVTTAVEHPATIEPMRRLERRGYTLTAVGVDATGRVDPEEIRRAIRPETILISVMHAQNEVGTLEPIAEIGAIAKSAGVLFHVDAAQSMGKAPVDVKAMQADFVSIAGHKLYAPKGIGALYVRSGVEVEPLICGASQESGRRAGTENVIMSVGLGKAAELAAAHLNDPTIARLRDRLWAGLSKAFGDRIVLNGHETMRLSGTLNVSFLRFVGGELLARVPEICASTGAACHSGDAKPSAVLTAMGISRERAIGAVRFSVGRPTTEDEIDRAIGLIVKAANSDRPIH